jgi:hypothetical protein
MTVKGDLMQKAPLDAGFRDTGVRCFGDLKTRGQGCGATVHRREVKPLHATPFRSEYNRTKYRDRLPTRHLRVRPSRARPATGAARNANRSESGGWL